MNKRLTAEQLVRAGADESKAASILERVTEILSSGPENECWTRISQEILDPGKPFSLHKMLHEAVFSDWDPEKGPRPAWFPSKEYIRKTNIGKLMQELDIDSYKDFHAWSEKNRIGFWELMVRKLNIRFSSQPEKTADFSGGIEAPEWFPGSALNIADSCIDVSDKAPAIVFQNENGPIETVSRPDLLSLVNKVANGLREADIAPGEPVAIDMPMTAESVAVYLGIVKAGCTVVGIADSFAPGEIRTRMDLGNAQTVFTQDHFMRAGKKLALYEKVIKAEPGRAVVLPAPEPEKGADASLSVSLRPGDLTWNEFLSSSDDFDSVPCSPSNYTNILFSSGTTGTPKAIPWTQMTPVKSAADGFLHHDIKPGDAVAWPTNLGWMMGPWLIYASLINKASIALYYGVPTGRQFGQFVQDTGLAVLGLVPSLVRAWRTTDCMSGFDWSSLKLFSSTGECSSTDDMLFLMSLAGYRPVIEYCGGTEIGGGYITGTVVQPSAPATFSTPALGLDFVILDENGAETDNGEVFLAPPSIGLSQNLLNRDHHEEYFADAPPPPPRLSGLRTENDQDYEVKLRRHGDQAERLGGDYFRIHGRADDTMNLGGIKVSSAEIERTLNRIDDILETAAIGVPAPGGGPARLVVYTVLNPGSSISSDDLRKKMQTAIKQDLNPLFKVYKAVLVDSLPRTASNKVMRRILRKKYSQDNSE